MSDTGPQAVNDGNRRARLNAMAEGGTAGVEAYDAAQSAAQQHASDARTGVINSMAWAPHNQMAAQAFGQQVSDRVAPKLRDAELARSLGGEQVGFDQAAYQSYMRIGEEGLAARRSAMEHRKTMDSLSRRLQDAEHSERLRSVRSGSSGSGGDAGFAGSGMDKTELMALLAGAGQLKQQEVSGELSETEGRNRKQQMLAEKARDALRWRAGLGNQRAATGVKYRNLDWGGTGNALMKLAAKERVKAKAAESVADKGEAVVARAAGRGDELAARRRLAEADDNRFAREAASAAGLSPEMAWGLFPHDESDVMDSLQDAESFENYLRTGYEGGAVEAAEEAWDESSVAWKSQALATAQEYGMSPDRVLEVADQFNLSDPALVPEQLTRIAENEQALVAEAKDAYSAREIVAQWQAAGELTDAEARYLLQQYGNDEAWWGLSELEQAESSESAPWASEDES